MNLFGEIFPREFVINNQAKYFSLFFLNIALSNIYNLLEVVTDFLPEIRR